MKRSLVGLLTLGALLYAATAFGHGLWVNTFANNSHPPGYVLANLGFGHLAPMDDLLTTEHATLEIASYRLIDPQGRATDLPKPSTETSVTATEAGVEVVSGDLGTCKLALSPDSQQGTYQVSAAGKDTFFSVWLDQNGRKRFGAKSLDQIDKPKKILVSMQYRASAKAYFAVDGWSTPARQGADLEIIPLSDLSSVRAGDEVAFEVSYLGKPLSSGADGVFTMTGTSRSFGGSGKTSIMSYIRNGCCRMRMPATGQWLMQVKLRKAVASTAGLAALKGKCQLVNYTSSLTFHVKP